MARLPRVFVQGGLYDVYNRASHGAAVLPEGDGGRELARLLSRELTAHGNSTPCRPELTDLRFLVVGLGIERWGQGATRLAEILGRRADYVTWWARRVRELRLSHSSWTERYEALDDKVRRRCEDAPPGQPPR